MVKTPLRIAMIAYTVSLVATWSLAMTSAPHREMKMVLDALASLGGKPIETLSPEEARKQPTPADAVKEVLEQQGKSTAPEPVARVEDQMIDGPAGPIPVRLYWPNGDGPFPVILYIHGGGWVIADLDTYDASPRALTSAVTAVVVSTHYRQGPEHKYPAAHDDVFAAYQWVVRNASSIRGVPEKIAVAGESAGGNMAAVVSLRARDRRVLMPVHQLLIYPVAGTDMDTESYRENANAKPLNKPMMAWFAKHYLGDGMGKGNPEIDLVSRRDLDRLPRTTIITADIDPLRSEGQRFGQMLRSAAVSVASKNYPGATHEFFGMGAVVPEAKAAVMFAAAEMKKTFSASSKAVN